MFYLDPTTIDLYVKSFVDSHRESAAPFRIGPSSPLLGVVAAAMGGFARFAARVERWARGGAAETAIANRQHVAAR
jgi:hypothetical protein